MIAIIDYKAGNLKSVECALKKLGFPCCITHNNKKILGSERIIFPGVGAAGQAIAGLRHLGLDKVLRQALETGKPILGICLGAQIILDKSEENSTPVEMARFYYEEGAKDELHSRGIKVRNTW